MSLVLINKSPPKEEPWRKFDKIAPVENEARLSDQALFCMPDASKVYPLLTRLEFRNVVLDTPSCQSTPFGILFKKAPYLKELYMDFTRFRPSMVSECLDAITANCMELTNLTIERLHNSTLSGQISIHTFFRTSRPGLRRLTLKGGVDLESALDLIPDGTANGLQHLRLEETISSHLVLHRLLQRCSSLQSLAWTMAVTESITDLSMRLSAHPEPWACYETLRHVEFGVDAMDRDSFDAYFRRLAQADRMASLSVPLCDLRRSIIKRGDDMKGWYFPSVQELTLRVGFTKPLCSLEELHYTLQAFPKLRKIRYEGTQYPLDDEARHYLASQVDRSVMVIHTTQLPTFVK
ncbi:hypothetical protein BGZ72_008061 [Mortierella alpina]|nr:hypothetical protein BGZ72_008061 [Mortierella alpina]